MPLLSGRVKLRWIVKLPWLMRSPIPLWTMMMLSWPESSPICPTTVLSWHSTRGNIGSSNLNNLRSSSSLSSISSTNPIRLCVIILQGGMVKLLWVSKLKRLEGSPL